MLWINKVVLSIFTIAITLIAICLNWSEFLMGSPATNLNLMVSIVFMLLWLIFSMFWGIRREKTYQKFILVYWGINVISFILIWIVSLGSFPALFLLPFSIWYGGPIYGFRYLMKSDISSLVLATAPLGFILSSLGYWIGSVVSKRNKP